MSTSTPKRRESPPTAPLTWVLVRGLTLCALLAFGLLLRGGLGSLPPPPAASSATVALGFLLLTAFLAGRIAADLGLPRITGYILIGLLVGPEALGVVTAQDVVDLRLIDDVAISLIALSAGGELRITELKARGRMIGGIMSLEMLAVFVAVGAVVMLLADHLPLTAGRDTTAVLVIAMVFGSIAIANSPSVAIAVINDTRSRGPVSGTVLGVTVLKDVAVIVLFALALSVARAALSPQGGFDGAFFLTLGGEIGGSLLAGVLSGVMIAALLPRIRRHVVVFALGIAFLNAFVANALHLELLLLSLVAGFFLENISPVHGEPFVRALEANALPFYALFFALAGASMHLAELATLWPWVLGFVAVRAVAIFCGTWAGARLTGAEPEVRRYAWLGFISQAGVTLGMVVMAARSFPEWGAELQTLFVAMVAVHELVGPVALQTGLRRAGETGARDAVEGEPAGETSARRTPVRGPEPEPVA